MSKIEKAAVGAVRAYVDSCPRLDSKINENDKTPFWDGDIFVYKSKSIANENFYGRVPVQVKGRKNSESYFLIERKEAEAFRADRGCLFFKVIIQNKPSGAYEATKIFYAFLSSVYIDTLLLKKSKTIRIDLKEVPGDPSVFEKEVIEFITKRNEVKVEKSSPNEIQSIVEQFENVRTHLNEINDFGIRMTLTSYLDSIKNIKEDGKDIDTVGWREAFIYYSHEAINLINKYLDEYVFFDLQLYFGNYLSDQKHFQLAAYYLEDLLSKIRELDDKFPDEYKINVAGILNSLGEIHKNLERYEEAEKDYKEALEIYELANSSTNSDEYIGDLATVLNNLAVLHNILGNYGEADDEYQQSLKIRKKLAKTGPEKNLQYVASTLNNLANMYLEVERYRKAEKYYKESINIYRTLAKNNPVAYNNNLAIFLSNLGTLHEELNHNKEAEDVYKESIEILCELAQNNPSAYMENMGDTIYNISLLITKGYKLRKNTKQVVKYALNIYKKIAEVYPQRCDINVKVIELLLSKLA